ncbi:betaine-aldehyde dehydrogenase [Vibrio penaeicida]|uniref:NAD/NADP-dependent betaine aldehyde dehydrogenase n=1 Tax=Vibrio penaeicida TaxID=104609 RepID=A0AAV5P057_9VIBR|nr:betaine-aldehyde dehydrogenase [Vibrio penaeicida]RTZ22670.1 betaine-aldehyde dehydrogenase [Vibrio penaeicida]GLQ75662.1 NAD/NADP-dependent betaine aldehyde dehydrogenase [Vibrio penaeicida]
MSEISGDLKQLFIGGEYVDATSKERFTSINPANGEIVCEIQQASIEDVDNAVSAAKEGGKVWARYSSIERSRILRQAAEYLREWNDEIALTEVIDTGKPIQEALEVDIQTGADVIEYYAGLVLGLQGVQQPLSDSQFFYTRREPLGVCAGIGAWNYPIQIACWKTGPALAAGNSMIFKPSEETPLSIYYLAEALKKAGLPDGVFNIVQGDYRVGQYLTRHSGIEKVSFTGECGTGRKVMQDAASTLKEVTMELGGKSPLMIFDDADIDNAVIGALLANFYTQGEVCTNGTRVFVQSGVYDEFLRKVKLKTEQLVVGEPRLLSTQVGALINENHLNKVLRYIDLASQSGAKLLCGGRRHVSLETENGYFVEPTVFFDCTDDMPNVVDEIFGPVMSVLKFDSESEVIERANCTEFGLAAGVFTKDVSRAHRVIAKIEAGICWINTWGASPAEMPVGGYKQSGIGRENGPETLNQYTQVKSVYVELGDIESPY